MVETLSRLRSLIDASFLAVPAGVQTEVPIKGLSAELDACFASFLYGDAPVPFAELRALAEEFRDRSRTLPEEVQRGHFDWLRVRNGWYKPVLGPDGRPCAPELPPGTLSVPMLLVPRLYEQIAELRYALHLRAHPSACDCAALRECGRFREPRSPELRSVGPTTDGYYFGDEFLCGACGARWFRGIGDDDFGTLFWEPSAAS
jgi:hypothetical protein